MTEPSDASSRPVTSTPERTVTPGLAALALQASYRVHVEREAALVLVQAGGHPPRAPVGEEPLHVRVDLGLAEDQLRAVADAFLPLVGRREVGLLHRRPQGDVADRVVRVRLRIGLPDLDTRLHQLAHRGLEVVVADDAARDPGRTGAGVRLVEDDDVGTGTDAARRRAPSPGGTPSRGRGSRRRRRRTERTSRCPSLLPTRQRRCAHDYRTLARHSMLHRFAIRGSAASSGGSAHVS